MINKENLILKRRVSKAVYKSLSLLIDLSEYVYLKLKYIKSNYKSIFISIFEEEDKSTLIVTKNNNKVTNMSKSIELLLNWFSSIFGAIEGNSVAVLLKKTHSFSVFFKSKLSQLFKKVTVSSFVSAVSVYFMVFYYFT